MTTTEKNIKKLHEEILDYFSKHNYVLEEDLVKQNIKGKNYKITYICSPCGTKKSKPFKEILTRECRNCKELSFHQIPTDYSVCPNDQDDEKWIAITGGFISSQGRACNPFGKLLTLDEKGRYYTGGKLQYVNILMATAFNIKDSDKLTGQHCSYIVRSNKEVDEGMLPRLENLYIGTRTQVGQESGKKSHQSEEFKLKINMSIVEHLKKFDYKTIHDLPHHLIFEDGNIYNDGNTIGCKRFLSFSKSSSKNEKEYNKLCTDEKTYYVHRLVCIAFYPKEGKINYDDYKDEEVNHIDGNTLNNHKDNLEWKPHSENMIHAYETKLNKKVQGVIQFEKLSDGSYGKEIARFNSIVKASQVTQIPEHEIRGTAKGTSKGIRGYLWKFQDEEKALEYSKKFSNRK